MRFKAILMGFSLFLVVGLSVALEACKKEVALQQNFEVDCDTVPATYAANIQPLLQASCATGQGPGTGCHDSWIGSYNSIKGKINNGSFELRLFQLEDMPVPNNSYNIPSLTEQEKATLFCWLAAGSPEN